MDNKPEEMDLRNTDWELFHRPGHLISRLARMMGRIGESRLRRLGFGIGQLPVLVMLKNGGALSQKELTRVAQIEQPSMAQMLARMERDGLIARIPDPADGRSSLIKLTELALSRVPEARSILLQGNKEALVGFSDSEIETLTGLLMRVLANLENMVENQTGEVE